MKTIWLSVLRREEVVSQQLMSVLNKYGLDTLGHYWENDNTNLAWMSARDALLNVSNPMWCVLGEREDFQNRDLRYGLSMTAMSLLSRWGTGCPIVLLQSQGELLTDVELPTPLSDATVLDVHNISTPAKLVGKAHVKATTQRGVYHMVVVGDVKMGQWIEVRPTGEKWAGIIFGVDEGEVRTQAVGPPGRLPEKTCLSCAIQSVKLEQDGRQFKTWSLQNEVSPDMSYYAKIDGCPRSLVFGALAKDNKEALYRVDLA